MQRQQGGRPNQQQAQYNTRQPAPSNAQHYNPQPPAQQRPPVQQQQQQQRPPQSQPQGRTIQAQAKLPQQQQPPQQQQQQHQRAGPSDLESQGYVRHNNPGKWINYTGGKATDFRIKGTTSTRVGLVHAITLRALDDFGAPAKIDNPLDFIGCVLTHQQTGSSVQCWYRDNMNCEYDLAFLAEKSGSIRMEIKLAGNPMFDIEIQVEDLGLSLWEARPRLPAKPKELFIIDIQTVDGSRPEGVAPFEVQTIGSVENLRLINNGDGTYRFQCVPQSHGHITIQLTLHGQPIKNSPVTAAVGDRQPIKIRQESTHEETLSDTRTPQQLQGYDDYDQYGDDQFGVPAAQPYAQQYNPTPAGNYGNNNNNRYSTNNYDARASTQYRDSTNVSNEDLTRLLDELGGDTF
eukprot:TRINITY_DN143_c0_g1_i1.p1 TRINITY_DN143_c0_g1~~TRINITY_DN143_c0_g1_i1.p1  ORF type:complete len:459 (-),score=111.33 TRINITY_DN143_c0_g1_i1:103-1314(-)